MEDWPALRWSPDYLEQVCGDELVEVMTGRDGDVDADVYPDRRREAMRFSEFVKKVKTAGQTNDFYLVSLNQFWVRYPSARRLFDDEIGATFPDYLSNPNGGKPYPGDVSFWFGPGGTVTRLHFDRQDVILAQVYGRKRVTMIPPSQVAFVYHERSVFSEVNVDQPDEVRHPLYRFADKFVFDLHPGEAVFIPVGWWHHVKSLDVSISLTFTNFPPYDSSAAIPVLPACP